MGEHEYTRIRVGPATGAERRSSANRTVAISIICQPNTYNTYILHMCSFISRRIKDSSPDPDAACDGGPQGPELAAGICV